MNEWGCTARLDVHRHIARPHTRPPFSETVTTTNPPPSPPACPPDLHAHKLNNARRPGWVEYFSGGIQLYQECARKKLVPVRRVTLTSPLFSPHMLWAGRLPLTPPSTWLVAALSLFFLVVVIPSSDAPFSSSPACSLLSRHRHPPSTPHTIHPSLRIL